MTNERLALKDLLEKAVEGDFLCSVARGRPAIAEGRGDGDGLIGRKARPQRRPHDPGATVMATGRGMRGGGRKPQNPEVARAGSHFPSFPEACKTTEKALVAVNREA